MFGRSVGVLATSALSASAFLIPAGIEPSKPAINNANWVLEVQTDSRLVRLPCSACAFSSREEHIEQTENDWFEIQGGANDVLLNYSVSTDGETLLLNGEPIFQMRGGALIGINPSALFVEQVPASTEWTDIFRGEAKRTRVEITGTGVGTSEIAELETGDMVTQLRSTIFGLGDIPVDLDAVILDLVQPKDGRLMILNMKLEERPRTELPPLPLPKDFFRPVDEVEAKPIDFEGLTPVHQPHFEQDDEEVEPHRPHGPAHPKECQNLPAPLCRLKYAIESKIMGTRKGGCPGRMGGKPSSRPFNGVLPTHIRPPPFPRPHSEHAPGPHEGRPHHMRPHGGRHHGHHHRFHIMHAFMRSVAAVLLPMMAGIAVGMTVSLVGLAVGRLISFIWISVVRGGRRGYASVALDDESLVDGDEITKRSFEEDDKEPLPLYEDAPAYEEVEKPSN